MSKILAAFYSATNVTAKLSKKLAEAVGANLYEIKPAQPYTKADLNWRDQNIQSSIEMKDRSFRPALAEMNANISEYDTILLGFPIWWYVAPRIIQSFLEAYDYSGKTIIVFATSGSSGFGNTVTELRNSVSDSAVIKEGKRFGMISARIGLKKWIETLGLTQQGIK